MSPPPTGRQDHSGSIAGGSIGVVKVVVNTVRPSRSTTASKTSPKTTNRVPSAVSATDRMLAPGGTCTVPSRSASVSPSPNRLIVPSDDTTTTCPSISTPPTGSSPETLREHLALGVEQRQVGLLADDLAGDHSFVGDGDRDVGEERSGGRIGRGVDDDRLAVDRIGDREVAAHRVEPHRVDVVARRRLAGERSDVVGRAGEAVDQQQVAARRRTDGEPERVGDGEPGHVGTALDRHDRWRDAVERGERDLRGLHERDAFALHVDGGDPTRCGRLRRRSGGVTRVDRRDRTAAAVDEHDLVPRDALAHGRARGRRAAGPTRTPPRPPRR